jgi:hypothetical protein
MHPYVKKKLIKARNLVAGAVAEAGDGDLELACALDDVHERLVNLVPDDRFDVHEDGYEEG